MIATVISADRLLGLLSQTIGNLDQAVIHFEDAMAFCRKAGDRPELAWTCCDYADMQAQLDSYEIEFYELVTPEKLAERGVS